MKKICCILILSLLIGGLAGSYIKSNNTQNYEDETGGNWKYELELSGYKNGKNIIYDVYSNDENLSFEQVWQSIISSDSQSAQAISEFYLISITIDGKLMSNK